MGKHFYVVFKPESNSKILKLPSAFLIKEGVEHVRLRTRSRGRGGESEDDDKDCISVEIYRCMKHVYLNRGWEKFVEKHYLEEKDFLLFKYDGGNCFSVRVFHPSGLEKVYDSDDTVNLEEDDDIDDDDEGETSNYKNKSKQRKIHHSPPDDIVKIEDDDDIDDDDDDEGETSIYKGRSNLQKFHHSPPARSQKNNSTLIVVKDEEEEDDDDEEEGETSNSKKRSKNQQQKIGQGTMKRSSHHSLPGESRRDSLMKDCDIIEEKMKDFSSPNPFMGRLMKDYNVNNRYIMNLPRPFVIKMMDEEAMEVILNLKNKEGTTWEVVLKEFNGQYFILPSGWRRFVVDNSLKVGDVCIFERVSGGQHSVTVWKIHVV